MFRAYTVFVSRASLEAEGPKTNPVLGNNPASIKISEMHTAEGKASAHTKQCGPARFRVEGWILRSVPRLDRHFFSKSCNGWMTPPYIPHTPALTRICGVLRGASVPTVPSMFYV